ncbi:MAG: hypothetical protein H0V17_06385 [Deltaproteobacteria bacterium]|nr:hypothetical protein [Deltaproteobacteria bacterium]
MGRALAVVIAGVAGFPGAGVAGFSGAAAADPIVNRDYAIELYDGVAIGDSSLTSMGGAGAARVNGSAGVLINASAPAVRRTTDNDSWSWDYHLDFLTGRFSTDYDNNGQVVGDEGGASLVTSGLALRFGKWSGALTVTGQTAPIDGSVMPELVAEALRVKFVIARWIPSWDLALGFGFQIATFNLRTTGGDQNVVFGLTGAAGVAGATWLPRGESYRVALALESRIVGNQLETTCDPEACDPDPTDADTTTYILPNTVEAPGRTIVGVAYRWAATPWNEQVTTKFRDEQSLTIAGDLVLAGSSANGHGIEAFAARELQRSGSKVTISPRLGAEVEALPGRLRVRAGSYWEPSRFEGVRGRIHGTFGLELRALELRLWGVRRGKLGLTTDFARRYRNIGFSIGFWH